MLENRNFLLVLWGVCACSTTVREFGSDDTNSTSGTGGATTTGNTGGTDLSTTSSESETASSSDTGGSSSTSSSTCIDNDSDDYFADCDPIDCDDADASVYTQATLYVDMDGDNHGNGDSISQCIGVVPDGYGTELGDCNDSDVNNWSTCTGCIDNDTDGYYAGCDQYVTVSGPDCDDTDSGFLINPAVPDLPDDGIDDDCSGADLTPSNTVGIFVSPNGNDSNAGTMSAPMLTLGAAVAEAEEKGKVVFVAAGTYSETHLVASVSLYGGYEDTNWTRKIAVNVTTIEGLSPPDTSNSVVAIEEPDGSVAFQGFSVQGPSSGVSYGRGVEILGGENAIFLADNVISCGVSETECRGVNVSGGQAVYVFRNSINGGDAAARTYGVQAWDNVNVRIFLNDIDGGGTSSTDESMAIGSTTGAVVNLFQNIKLFGGYAAQSYGVYHYSGGDLDVAENTIDGGNGASSSIAVYHLSDDGDVTLLNNRILGGTGSTSRGVYLTTTSSMYLINNIIRAGDGTTSQGMYLSSGTLLAVNNTIYGGSSSSTGVTMVSPTVGTFINNIVLGTASVDAFLLNSGTVSFYNNDLSSAACDLKVNSTCITDEATINACGFSGCTVSSGNIVSDPSLNVSGHLQASSPCIDAGTDPSSWYAEPFSDVDGDPRPQDVGWDIGYDEY